MPDVLSPAKPKRSYYRPTFYPVRIECRLTQAIGDAVQHHCAQTGQTPTQVLRPLIEAWVKRHARRQAPRTDAGADEGAP
jgi:hypothetical protein